MYNLGNTIKKLRENAKKTLSDVAEETGVGPSTISDIENGKAKDPKISTLQKLAEYFKVSMDYLLGNTDIPTGFVIETGDMPDVMKPFLKSKSRLTITLDGNDGGTPEERKKAIEDMLKEVNAYDRADELSQLLDLLPEDKKGKPISMYDLYDIIGSNKHLMKKLESVDSDVPSKVSILNSKNNIGSAKTIPSQFTNPTSAREYISMHQIFASEGFNPNKMSDEDVLDFANEMLKQMELISYKYKK